MCSTCSFDVFASAAVAHGIIVILKKSISYFMNIMYKHIFLNFGVISFINKEMVSLFKLHTYNFGLVYIAKTKVLICVFVFTYAKCWFSHAAAHILGSSINSSLQLMCVCGNGIL